ncbi:MAG: YggU family protein [Deltaproteobacteria bacterium]|nr:MAG: YggU family protein [Deltaproteobacteria bacterium]
MLKIDADKIGLKFNIYVQPRSSRNQVVGLHGDALKVKIKAPPVEGAANKMCIAVLAKALNVPKSAVEIVSGHSARTKRLLIQTARVDDTDKEIKRIKMAIRSLGSAQK